MTSSGDGIAITLGMKRAWVSSIRGSLGRGVLPVEESV